MGADITASVVIMMLTVHVNSVLEAQLEPTCGKISTQRYIYTGSSLISLPQTVGVIKPPSTELEAM